MDRVHYESIVIQDIVNLDRNNELNLTPWYQRRSVWNTNQKSYLINTLLERKPIPALYIRHSVDLDLGKSIREVVDGQQRTRTILEYYKNKFSAKHPSYDNKVFYSELKKRDKESFVITPVPIGYLLGASDGDVIDIFARINSISKSLNTQEKLNAEFSGEFKQFCLEEAVSRLNFWRDYNIFSATLISRMNEVSFISDIVINILIGLTDNTAPKTKKFYEQYDDNFPNSKTIHNELNRIFDLLVSIDPSAIKDTIFNRPPILFSLIVSLNQNKRVEAKKIQSSIFEIDTRFNLSVDDRTKRDDAFIDACKSSTARNPQRKTRHNYITSFLTR